MTTEEKIRDLEEKISDAKDSIRINTDLKSLYCFCFMQFGDVEDIDSLNIIIDTFNKKILINYFSPNQFEGVKEWKKTEFNNFLKKIMTQSPTFCDYKFVYGNAK